jgi:uncharacterized protein
MMRANALYYKSNRSISAAVIFHFTFNLFSVLLQTEQFTKCIITVILLIISIVIIWRNQAFFFDQAKPRLALAAESEFA